MSAISYLNEKAFPFEGKGILLWTLSLFFLPAIIGTLQLMLPVHSLTNAVQVCKTSKS